MLWQAGGSLEVPEEVGECCGREGEWVVLVLKSSTIGTIVQAQDRVLKLRNGPIKRTMAETVKYPHSDFAPSLLRPPISPQAYH